MLLTWLNNFFESLGLKLKQKKFNLVGVLTILKCYCLQLKILDQIITLVKSWLYDLHLNCIANINFKNYIKFEVALIEENYELIEESEYFEKLQVDND